MAYRNGGSGCGLSGSVGESGQTARGAGACAHPCLGNTVAYRIRSGGSACTAARRSTCACHADPDCGFLPLTGYGQSASFDAACQSRPCSTRAGRPGFRPSWTEYSGSGGSGAGTGCGDEATGWRDAPRARAGEPSVGAAGRSAGDQPLSPSARSGRSTGRRDGAAARRIGGRSRQSTLSAVRRSGDAKRAKGRAGLNRAAQSGLRKVR